jgi:hypothetical protein
MTDERNNVNDLTWIDGSALDFKNGENVNLDDMNQKCVRLGNTGNGFKWLDSDCSAEYHFVCREGMSLMQAYTLYKSLLSDKNVHGLFNTPNGNWLLLEIP